MEGNQALPFVRIYLSRKFIRNKDLVCKAATTTPLFLIPEIYNNNI